MKRTFILLALVLILFLSCTTHNQTLNYGGARASRYGIKPFPQPEEWGNIVSFIKEETGAASSAVIWIVGVITSDRGESWCRLNFPSDGLEHEKISFHTLDENEATLDYFDRKGIDVYLQVEPGDADVEELIDLVLNQYGHHRSVIGFGVDMEWYKIKGTEGWGTKGDDVSSEIWEKKIKEFDKDYDLFLKHWDSDWMPPAYRGDIIFVNDSQGFQTLESMKDEFSLWADTFYPNMVFFQTGYEADKDLWITYDSPVEGLNKLLTEDLRQPCGFFWVDFTLKDIRN
jgi:hypothetical protein